MSPYVQYVQYQYDREVEIFHEFSYLCLAHVCPCFQPSFLADSAPGVCRELATHLLAGVKILNPFINPESFRSDWIVWEPLALDCSFAIY